MGYFVEHPGGQRYGPADLQMLNQWAAEGRLIPTTMLVDEVTGAQFYAQDVPGLLFPGAPQVSSVPGVGTPLGGYSTPQSQPTYTPYGPQTPLYRAPGASRNSSITTSYVASIFGMVMICCIPALGLVAGIAGVGLALSARNADPRGAQSAMWLGIAVTIMNVAMIVGAGYLMHILKLGG